MRRGEQKELVDIINLAEVRIEGMGKLGIFGFSSDLLAARAAEIGFTESVDDRINEVFENLFGWGASNFRAAKVETLDLYTSL